MKASTQLVLDMLSRSESVCASAFLDRGIGRFGARVFELRRLDYIITLKPCKTHDHPHGVVYRYCLEGKRLPDPGVQLSLEVG